jgi:hypothetical protein
MIEKKELARYILLNGFTYSNEENDDPWMRETITLNQLTEKLMVLLQEDNKKVIEALNAELDSMDMGSGISSDWYQASMTMRLAVKGLILKVMKG